MSKFSKSANAKLVAGGVFFFGFLSFGVIKSCATLNGNKDIVDTNKDFNIAIDYTGKGVSLVKINRYSDYQGQTIEYVTEDNLVILTGLTNTELMYVCSYEEAYNRALELCGIDPSSLICYDENQEIELEYWNKNLFNLNYDFNYVIVEDENGVTVRKIDAWRDWEEDDKVQFTDTAGNVYLSSFDNVKLVNNINAPEDALYRYVLSLSGSEDRIIGDDISRGGYQRKLSNNQ